MECDGETVPTFDSFSKKISDFIYTPLVMNSAQPAIASLIKEEFPTVVRQRNLATGGKFYSDILNMLQQLEPQRSNQLVRNVISTLQNYVVLIQDGTVEIKDNR
jgi:hypothetical protein